MNTENGKHIMELMRQKWQRFSLLNHALLALIPAVILMAILHYTVAASFWWSLPLFILFFVLNILTKKNWQLTTKNVAVHLNRTFPSLEESAELLLKPANDLNLLEKLQARKTLSSLQNIIDYNPYSKRFKFVGIVAFAVSLLSIVAFTFIPAHVNKSDEINKTIIAINKSEPEKVLPDISSFTVTIEPPSYTHKSIINQKEFNIVAPEDAIISWKINTNIASDLTLEFNDTTEIKLIPQNKEHTAWVASKRILKSGFYQVKLNNQLSELYKIEMIKDQIPSINIQSPKQNTIIEAGEPQRFTLNAKASDDYGIKDAIINATIATGSGEAVKFKEQKIKFPISFSAALPNYQLNLPINLKEMGLQPADELYFFITVTDTHQQQTKSDVYVVSLADTAQLMSLNVSVSPGDIKPEYFRSERQIIIETEQLLKDKDTISEAAFKNKSNDLATDQKLLRLRYGKFLGEEEEGGLTRDAMNSLSNPSSFGDNNKIMEVFTDKHDNAEDASFLDASTKKQLLATLTEMWKAELPLRIFKPQEALPFEYKALRLLKDLQQQSRAYVSKTGTKTTPLNPAKRLTGELDKIIEPISQNQYNELNSANDVLRNALGILELLKEHPEISSPSINVLQQAAVQMQNEAASNPAKFIASLQSMRRVVSLLSQQKVVLKGDINLSEKGIANLLNSATAIPSKQQTSSNNLSKQYFIHLSKQKQ